MLNLLSIHIFFIVGDLSLQSNGRRASTITEINLRTLFLEKQIIKNRLPADTNVEYKQFSHQCAY